MYVCILVSQFVVWDLLFLSLPELLLIFQASQFCPNEVFLCGLNVYLGYLCFAFALHHVYLFCLFMLFFLKKLSYFLDSFLYSNERERERERKVWVWMGGEVGRIWEEFGGGHLNQNVLYEKHQ